MLVVIRANVDVVALIHCLYKLDAYIDEPVIVLVQGEIRLFDHMSVGLTREHLMIVHASHHRL